MQFASTRFVYVTTPDKPVALAIGRSLVEARLATCVNVLGEMESIYQWKGEIEQAREAVLIVKTEARLVDAVTAAVKELHPYEIPCVVALPVDGGNPDYLAWLARGLENGP